MRTAAFAIALLMGGAAFAQTTMSPTTDTTAQTMAVQAPAIPTAGQMVQPSNADPERDARGIRVISDPAVVPPGFNLPPGTTAPAVGGPILDPSGAPMATEPYPPCSRTVTDKCLQTYERGRSAT
jgi:hypothetical protein